MKASVNSGAEISASLMDTIQELDDCMDSFNEEQEEIEADIMPGVKLCEEKDNGTEDIETKTLEKGKAMKDISSEAEACKADSLNNLNEVKDKVEINKKPDENVREKKIETDHEIDSEPELEIDEIADFEKVHNQSEVSNTDSSLHESTSINSEDHLGNDVESPPPPPLNSYDSDSDIDIDDSLASLNQEMLKNAENMEDDDDENIFDSEEDSEDEVTLSIRKANEINLGNRKQTINQEPHKNLNSSSDTEEEDNLHEEEEEDTTKNKVSGSFIEDDYDFVDTKEVSSLLNSDKQELSKATRSSTEETEEEYDDDIDYEEEDEDDAELDAEIGNLYNEIDILQQNKQDSDSSTKEEGSNTSVAEAVNTSEQSPTTPASQPSRKRQAEEEPDSAKTKRKKSRLEDAALMCYICKKEFSMTDLLGHFSVKHFSKDIIKEFPIRDGEYCTVCVEEGKEKKFTEKIAQKANFSLHIGKVHMRVLRLLPEPIQRTVVGKLLSSHKISEEALQRLDLGHIKPIENEIGHQPLPEPMMSLEEESEPSTSMEAIRPELSFDANNSSPDKLKIDISDSSMETEELSSVTEGPSLTKNKGPLVGYNGSFECTICKDGKKMPRGGFIDHLTKSHHFKDLSQAYGSKFSTNEKCPLCLSENKAAPIVMKNRTDFMRHVGNTHKKTLDFVKDEVLLKSIYSTSERKLSVTSEVDLKNCTDEKTDITPGPSLAVVPSTSKRKSLKSEIRPRSKSKSEQEDGMWNNMDDAKENIDEVKVNMEDADTPKSSKNAITMVKCGECGRNYKSKQALNRHMKSHVQAQQGEASSVGL